MYLIIKTLIGLFKTGKFTNFAISFEGLI
jgi:hypothetical protein